MPSSDGTPHTGARDVVLVRHGATSWSTAGRHTGRTDVPLSDLGRAQGMALAPVLARWRFEVALASPSRRAAETAELAGIQVVVDEDLQEWDYGDHEGRTTAEIRIDVPDWTVFRGAVPGGETIGQVGVRADRVIERIERIDGDVAIFSHGHLLRVLASRWLGLPAVDGRLLMLDPATVCVLGTEHETRAIRVWNDVPSPSGH
jgi:broad specificity phosphatase PhoE